MKISSQLLLTFLLNACWQIALVAALASVSSWLLRNSAARYRHWVWVAALFLSVGIPLTTSSQFLISVTNSPASIPQARFDGAPNRGFAISDTRVVEPVEFESNDAYLLTRPLAIGLLALYVAVLSFGLFRLLHAWITTKRLRRTTVPLEADDWMSQVVQKCSIAITGAAQPVQVCSSSNVPVPVTIGVFKPVIVLPADLLNERNDELLMSAIGHELVHVRRRDYALNLVYELLYLPLSFHPAAALIRRRIRQTRELSCDELVAERILNAETYARSLVKLASSAPTLNRLSMTTTVGIADADILEARIMTLLKKPKMDTRRKRIMLIVVSLFLLVPCLAAASFAMKFDLEPTTTMRVAQEPVQQEKERMQKVKESMELRQRTEAEAVRAKLEQLKYQNEMKNDPKLREEFEAAQAKLELLEKTKERMGNEPQFREELEAKREIELKMRAVRQSALTRAARITMDQAIQIATSQKPGKVLECSLDAEHWKEPGVLAADGFVFYRVMLVPSDDSESGVITHVWVNAVDGTLIKTENELPRKQRRPE